MKAFRPVAARTVNIDVGAASARVALGGPTSALRVVNDGTATAWIEFGDGTVVAAAATGVPIRAGATEFLTFDNANVQPTHFAAIAAGATGKIYVTPGSAV